MYLRAGGPGHLHPGARVHQRHPGNPSESYKGSLFASAGFTSDKECYEKRRDLFEGGG